MSKNLELKLILSGDGKQLVAVTKDAEGRIKRLGSTSFKTSGTMARGMRAAGKSISSLNQQAAKTLSTFSKWSGVAATLATGALGAIVTASNKNIDALAKTADKIGVTTESLASLQYAGELTGVSISTMNMALQRMTRRVSEAASGTGEAKDAIKELGLDAKELERIGPDKAFVMISEAMKGVENQSDRVRLAMKLFDSEGVALVNTMNLGAEGLNKAAKEAEQFGLAISRVDAAKVEAANDAMTRASSVMTGLGTALAVEVAPYIEAVANNFAKAAAEADGFGEVAGKALDYVTVGVGVMADGLHGIDIIFTGLKGAASGFGVFVAHIFESIDRAAVDLLNMLPGVSMQYSATLSDLKNTFIQSTEESFNALQQKLGEPLPSEQIKNWMAEVKAANDEKNAAIEAATQQSHAAIENSTIEHGKTMSAIASANGKLENAAVKTELDKQIQTREQYTQTLLNQVKSAYEKRRQILKNALDGELIDHQQYSEKIAQQQAQMQREIARINDNSEQLYRQYLNSLAAESDQTARNIAASMAGAAQAMAGSFQAAAAQSTQALQQVSVPQMPQQTTRETTIESPYYDGRNREVIGYYNPGGFALDVPIWNEPRVRSTGGGQPTTYYNSREYTDENGNVIGYYHSGGIVGKDLGSREVATTLRQDEGVFTENQMKALAPVKSLERAIAAAIKQHGTGRAANAKMDDFLAEYARINAKHIENFEIAAIRFNDRFSASIEKMPRPTIATAPARTTASLPQYRPQTTATPFAQYKNSRNTDGNAQKNNKQLDDLIVEIQNAIVTQKQNVDITKQYLEYNKSNLNKLGIGGNNRQSYENISRIIKQNQSVINVQQSRLDSLKNELKIAKSAKNSGSINDEILDLIKKLNAANNN